MKKFEWYLIAGGLLWAVLWTGHTIAHDAPGLLLMLAGMLVFGIGFLRVGNFGFVIKMIPLAVSLWIPFISYLRRPGSPLLEWGPMAGYVLLESVGALFGVCWIILGLDSLSRAKGNGRAVSTKWRHLDESAKI